MLSIVNRLPEGSQSLSMITLSPHMGRIRISMCKLHVRPPVPGSWDGPSTYGVGLLLAPIAKEDANIGDLR